MVNDLAGTSAGFGRRGIGGNCCCYYWDCCSCSQHHTERCPLQALGFVCHTVGLLSCPRQQVDNQWGAVGGDQELAPVQQLLDAFDCRRERQSRFRGRHGLRPHAVVLLQPCVGPLPLSSWPSIPCVFL